MRIPYRSATTRSAYMLVIALVALVRPWNGAAQDRPVLCPPPFPFPDVEAFLEHLDGIASGEVEFQQRHPAHAVIHVVNRALLPEERLCPSFDPPADLRAAMIRVMEFGRDHPEVGLSSTVLQAASSTAYRYQEQLGWDPTDFLFDVLGAGRTEGARVAALDRLVERATEPGVRGRLLALARQPRGPDSWPDLPVDLVKRFEFRSSSGSQALEAEVLAAPDQLAHPRARWEVECGRGHEIPRGLDDPCHPANAPPRIDGRSDWPPGGPVR